VAAANATPKAAPAAKAQARSNQTPARGTANGGRPSLTQAMAGYQRVDVNATEGGMASGVENGVGNEPARPISTRAPPIRCW